MGMPPMAASPELIRYKGILAALSVGYLGVVVVGVIAGNLSNVLNDLFVLLAASMMAFKSSQYMGQCLFPFMLFSFMAAVFDILIIIPLLSSTRTPQTPGSGDLFSTSCSYLVNITLPKDTQVFSAGLTETLLQATTGHFEVQPCSWQWVAGNIAVIVSCLLDLSASALACRMFKEARNSAEAGDPMLGGGGGDMFGGGGGFGGAGGGGVDPGPGGGPGGGGAGGPGGPNRPPGGGQPNQGGFMAFQGGGQRLGG